MQAPQNTARLLFVVNVVIVITLSEDKPLVELRLIIPSPQKIGNVNYVGSDRNLLKNDGA